jgi:hypothetical protein
MVCVAQGGAEMDHREILDAFGSEFVKEARDQTIKKLQSVMGGSVRSSRGQHLHDEIATLSSEGAAKAEHLARAFIDETLHNVLWMFERSERFDIVETPVEGTAVSITDASDGLAGELHSVDGWLARFSFYGEGV